MLVSSLTPALATGPNQVGSIIIHHPHIGCCGATCGDSCAACCDNVVYEPVISFNFTNAWSADLLADPPCDAGSASSGPFDLSSYYAVYNHETEEWGPVEYHPCEWQWEIGRPMKMSAEGPTVTPVCGDVTVGGVCRPSGFPGCYEQTFYVTRARFFSICKIPFQEPGSPYEDMPQIGDITTEPASCTVTAGTSLAGWCGEISITSEPDCTDPAIAGHATCSIAYLVNTKGVGLFPGDPTGYMKFGICQSGSEGCDDWRCCDPFSMRFYLGAWITQLPDPNFLTQSTPDYISCEDEIAHKADVDYPLSEIPYLDVTANHTCTPSGMEMMAKLRRMPDKRLRHLVKSLLAEKARAAV